jgi:hypothetical protein
MKRFLGYFDLLFGAVFGILALVALSGVPSAFSRISEEPEDFYGLLFLAAASLAVAAASVLVGCMLLRHKSLWKISFSSAALVSIVVSIVLVLASLIGFWPNDPSSIEFRFLLLPAVLLGASFFLLRRKHRV